MPIPTYPDFFNDVFGPVMQPGSSSHTAGPCRLGYLANSLLGESPRRALMQMDRNSSYAGTFGLMAEDSAMLAGALGMLPNDARLFQSRRLAAEWGVDFAFEFGELQESTHPNAVKFSLSGASGAGVTLVGDSTGGGMVLTQRINGYPLQVRGDSYVALMFDLQGQISSDQAERLAIQISGVVQAGTSAAQGLGCLHYFRTAVEPDMAVLRAQFPGIQIALLKLVLPVLAYPGCKPQLFDSMAGWRQIALEQDRPLWEIALQYQMDYSGWERERIIDYMRMIERKMHRQTHAVYEEGLDAPTSPFKPDLAGGWARHMASQRRLADGITAETIRWVYGAGAGIPGVEAVAGPMGSGGGHIHAALWAVKEAKGFTEQDLLRGLFVAAGIGAIAYTRTEPTGEVTGCSGETGICGAMAAAAICEMAGGTPEQVENAASLLLQASTGMPYDPIPGGNGQPCRSRILTTICTLK
jgi:L-serine dehydratase